MDQCPICLLDIESGLLIKTKCCKQNFHTSCYDTWVNINPICPMCRKEQIIKKNDLLQISKTVLLFILFGILCYLLKIAVSMYNEYF